MTNNTLLIEFTNEPVEGYSEEYQNDLSDSGFDLYIPENITIPPNSHSIKIHLGVKAALYPTESEASEASETVGYMLLPRSSTGSKTPLRLSNSVGIIDRGYRGELIACVDNLSNKQFVCEKGSRLFQIVPFCGNGVGKVTFGKLNETLRSSGGFGSSGK